MKAKNRSAGRGDENTALLFRLILLTKCKTETGFPKQAERFW